MKFNDLMGQTLTINGLLVLAQLFIGPLIIAQNNAIHLAGTDDQLLIQDAHSVDIQEEITMMFWAATKSPQPTTNKLIDKDGAYGVKIFSNDGIRFETFGGDHAGYGGAFISDGNWHHYALTGTIQGASERKLYVDGQLFGTNTSTYTIETNASNLTIGASSNAFTGKVDEVNIWNRALSQVEIQQYLNCQLLGTESGLATYYNFEEGMAYDDNTNADTVKDITANANHGVLTNMTLSGNESNFVNSFAPVFACPCTDGNISIVQQPLGNTLSGCDSVQFNIMASGNNLTYQWQESVDGGTTFCEMEGIQGMNQWVALFDAFQNQYRCLIKNNCEIDTSAVATVNCTDGTVSISQQPTSQTVARGETVSFTLTATGDNLCYQWQESYDGGQIFHPLAGGTNDTLSFEASCFINQNQNQYRCLVYNNCGIDTTNAATLTAPYELTEAEFSRLDSASEWRIDSIMLDELKAQGLPGVSIVLVKNGEIVYLKGYGYADLDLKIKATGNTLYRSGSVAKHFTGITALKLWDDGLLDFNQTVQHYVPEFPVKREGAITIDQLLHHTSGLPHTSEGSYDFSIRDQYIAAHPTDMDPIANLEAFKDVNLLFTPGTSYDYSGNGFNLMTAVNERAAGEPIEVYSKREIWTPLDLPFFNFEYPGLVPYYNQAIGYNDNLSIDKGGRGSRVGVNYLSGSGGNIGTVRDWGHFIVGMVNGNLLSQAAINLLGTGSTHNNYGIGNFDRDFNGDKWYGHNGSVSWAKTELQYAFATKDGVAVMLNRRNEPDPGSILVKLRAEIATLGIVGTAYVNPIPKSLAAPTINVPVNNATNQTLNLTLSWDAVPFADVYEIVLDTFASFQTADTLNVRGLKMYNVCNLQNNKTYYWKVRAVNQYLYSGTNGAWSTVFKFSTGDSNLPVSLPFIENFESVNDQFFGHQGTSIIKTGKGFQWSYQASHPFGRAKLGHWAIQPKDGYGGLTLDMMPDDSSVTDTNYVILKLNVANYENLSLSFDYVVHGDESHVNDRVWIRGSAEDSWIEAYNWYSNKAANGVYKSVTEIDLDQLLAADNQSASSTFMIRFGQEDTGHAENFTSNDGVSFDNIRIDGNLEDCDNGIVTLPTTDQMGIIPEDTYENNAQFILNGQVAASTTVVIKAINNVLMQPGFHAVAGSNFTAQISDCTLLFEEEETIETFAKLETEAPPTLSPSLHIYPNPTQMHSTIQFVLPKSEAVQLRLFDITGQLLQTWLNGQQLPAGTHQVEILGQGLSEGIYFIQLQTSNRGMTKKWVLSQY